MWPQSYRQTDIPMYRLNLPWGWFRENPAYGRSIGHLHGNPPVFSNVRRYWAQCEMLTLRSLFSPMGPSLSYLEDVIESHEDDWGRSSFFFHPGLVKRDFFQPMVSLEERPWSPAVHIGRVKSQYASPGCRKNGPQGKVGALPSVTALQLREWH